MYSLIETPFGNMQAQSNGQLITRLHFCNSYSVISTKTKSLSLHKELQKQIDAYFSGQLKQFSIPYQLEATPFQKQVWDALGNIPYGKTISYYELGQIINSPKAFQAIGQANKKNPIQLVIPCHRVIKKNEDFGGYAAGSEIKKFLLYHESYYL